MDDYYNGHGAPKPSGELLCFNRTYTQYILISIQEVQGYRKFTFGTVRLLEICYRTSTCKQNDEITKLASYMVGIPFPEGAQLMMNSI